MNPLDRPVPLFPKPDVTLTSVVTVPIGPVGEAQFVSTNVLGAGVPWGNETQFPPAFEFEVLRQPSVVIAETGVQVAAFIARVDIARIAKPVFTSGQRNRISVSSVEAA